MGDIVTESLLEMHFHRALVEYFSNLYGARFLKLLKPSQQHEAWIGFDQGWVNTTLSTEQLLHELRTAISSGKTQNNNFYIGYFLQFKKVEEFFKRSKFTPNHYSVPYYRTELSLYPNSLTGLSQHETLLILQNIRYASVFYACGMLFNIDDIYDMPDLSKLRMVPISDSPNGWATNTRHFIYFQTPTDSPFWCSEPIKGKSYTFDEWASGKIDISPKPLDRNQLNNLINETIDVIFGEINLKIEEYEFTKYLPKSMTILEFEKIE